MGTNYYIKPFVDEQTHKLISELVRNRQYYEVKKYLPEEIHIGKLSGGWQFLFNHHNWEHFDQNIESFQEFLLSGVIVDEYKTTISIKDFWSKVRASEEMINGKEYYTNWDKYHTGRFKCKKPTDVPANFYEEYHFGLRFSDSTEFS